MSFVTQQHLLPSSSVNVFVDFVLIIFVLDNAEATGRDCTIYDRGGGQKAIKGVDTHLHKLHNI